MQFAKLSLTLATLSLVCMIFYARYSAVLWLGSVVCVLSCAVIAVLLHVGNRARWALRDADERIGIPIPDDDEQVYALELDVHSFGLLNRCYEDFGKSLPDLKELRRLDDDFVGHLHQLRASYVDGDVDRWRDLPEALHGLADQVRDVLADSRAKLRFGRGRD